MAEDTGADARTTSPKPLFSFFPKIDFKTLPFFNLLPNPDAKLKEEKQPKAPIAGDGEGESGKTSVGRVSFPNVAPKVPEPLGLEAEESAGRTSNPVVLWQVYALGGFLILRWVWARWTERNERDAKKESPDDDDQTPADDEDSYAT
ncbi:uncharacterized protein LOC110809191 [Carica papaya]|uniref:uncharacterized protein LOC110809191 n=1 Tax=Carica papaya TaxID=3649 RepID=UPI000B8CB6B0|nr:uncharacterized protein LOC110809191 [Carica papaya]